MKRFCFVLAFTVTAVCLLLPVRSHALDLQSITQQAQQAAGAGNNTRALGLFELALTQSIHQPEAVSGPLQGEYWRLIGKTGDFPRALDFFTALELEQKSPGAAELANRANAIGSYLGWLFRNHLEESVSPGTLHAMDATARSNYARALALAPDSFTALYGYAIYESYAPNGQAHMRELLSKLNSLRASHPHYPWSLVDYLEQHGHPQL